MSDLHGVSPHDVRLPNRRTARSAETPNKAAELEELRRQLTALQQEALEDVSARGKGADRRPDVALDEEVTTLYHELQRATAKLEEEKMQRKRAESDLELIRQQRLRETADAVSELEKKRNELQALREERAMMKEWLDRGVAECKRVAEEVIRLKTELESNETTNSQLIKGKNRLSATVQQLSEQLAATQIELEKAHHQKSLLELNAKESTSVINVSEQERKAAVEECERLAAEVMRLAARVRSLDEAELSMQGMISCLVQLIRDVNDTELEVATCGTESPPFFGGANSSAPAVSDTEPRPLQSMLIDSKRRLQELQDTVGRLRTTVKRFVAQRQRQHLELIAQHRTALEALQNEKDTADASHRLQMESMQQRIVDLEREIIMVADGVCRDTEHEAQQRMQQLDEYAKIHRELSQQVSTLKAENETLRAKAKKMKLDWTKVDISRRRYQQLEAEVTLMQEHCQKLTAENKNLRLMLQASGIFRTADETGRSDVITRNAFEEWRCQKLQTDGLPTGSFGSPRSPSHEGSTGKATPLRQTWPL